MDKVHRAWFQFPRSNRVGVNKLLQDLFLCIAVLRALTSVTSIEYLQHDAKEKSCCH